MAVAVPDVAFNLRVLQAGDKPRAGVEAWALSDEDWVNGFVQFMLESLESSHRVGVEVDRSCGAVLCLCEVDGAPIEMDLSPGQ